jgi:hypothetical protein
MNPLEKIKLSRELLNLVAALKANKYTAMAKIKASRRVLDIVKLLGGETAVQGSSEQATVQVEQEQQLVSPNALFQSVIDGAEITVELVESVFEEAKKLPQDPLLPQAASIIKEKTLVIFENNKNKMGAAAGILPLTV